MKTQTTKTQVHEVARNGDSSISAIETIALSAPVRTEFKILKM